MLGDNLKTLRKMNHYTQEQIAEKLNISRQAVAKWERGETAPDITNLVSLAQLYKVTLDQLVKYDDQQEGVPVPPKGKHMMGTVVLDAKGRIELPLEARQLFNLKEGTEILVLADEEQGLALVEKQLFLQKIHALYQSVKEH